MCEKVIETLPAAAETKTNVAPEPVLEPGVGDAAGLSPAATVTPIETISDAEPATEPTAEQPDDTASLPIADEVAQTPPVKQEIKKPVSKPADAPAKPAITKAAPQVQVKKAPARRSTTQPAPAKPKPEPRTNTIRVYDENGNPIR